jgi:hypothetical protein
MADHTQAQAFTTTEAEPLSVLIDSHLQVPAFTFAGGGGAAPVIGNFSPSVGTPIGRNESVSFDVTDDTGLLRAEIWVTLGIDTFVVHDGDVFLGAFAISTRSTIAGGFRFTVRRNGGWPSSPTFTIHATDTAGQEVVV